MLKGQKYHINYLRYLYHFKYVFLEIGSWKGLLPYVKHNKIVKTSSLSVQAWSLKYWNYIFIVLWFEIFLWSLNLFCVQNGKRYLLRN